MTELAEMIEELVRKARSEIEFEWQLGINEMFYGSAYGPWLPPKPLKGIAALL